MLFSSQVHVKTHGWVENDMSLTARHDLGILFIGRGIDGRDDLSRSYVMYVQSQKTMDQHLFGSRHLSPYHVTRLPFMDLLFPNVEEWMFPTLSVLHSDMNN